MLNGMNSYAPAKSVADIKLNEDRTMFLTSKDASDAITLYWKGPVSVRETQRLGQWVMNTFFPSQINDRIYYERCHSCCAQVITQQLVEELA